MAAAGVAAGAAPAPILLVRLRFFLGFAAMAPPKTTPLPAAESVDEAVESRSVSETELVSLAAGAGVAATGRFAAGAEEDEATNEKLEGAAAAVEATSASLVSEAGAGAFSDKNENEDPVIAEGGDAVGSGAGVVVTVALVAAPLLSPLIKSKALVVAAGAGTVGAGALAVGSGAEAFIKENPDEGAAGAGAGVDEDRKEKALTPAAGAGAGAAGTGASSLSFPFPLTSKPPNMVKDRPSRKD